MLLAPEIVPPVIETELASCVAIVPRPMAVLAPDCVVEPVPPDARAKVPATVTAPVVDVEGVKPVEPNEMLETPDAAAVAHTGAPPLTVRTWPALPTASLDTVLAAEA
jgi:hypothetical protein